jgi:nifR3 family TIM-barrel protein
MDGVTDLPFRRFIRTATGSCPYKTSLRFVSEFLSTDGTGFLTPANLRASRFDKEEEPFCMQVFGHSAEKLAAAALQTEEMGAAFVELNAGCPAKRIANKGSGAGLLRDLPNLRKILHSMKSALKIPLFLKCRIGWDENSICINEVLEIAEGEGVEQLTIHGRTKTQGYAGFANWNVIGSVAAKAKIPVIGNGDISSAENALDRIKNYNVKGISIGRAALQNPWIFLQILAAMKGKEHPKITPPQVCEAICRYESLLREDHLREGQILGRLKQISSQIFMLGALRATPLRLKILRTQSVQEFLDNWRNLSASAFSFPYSVGS